MPSKESKEAAARTAAVIKTLRRQYPRDSQEQIAKRLRDLAEKDDKLRNDLAAAAVGQLLDEQYNESARKGRTIPDHLKRPS
jgi:hypothetical protein